MIHEVNYEINLRPFISDSESDISEDGVDSNIESDDSVENQEIDEDGNILVDKKED